MMMKSFVRLWMALALTLAACAVHAADAAVISLSGQQRMLSQRIVKAWCQIGLNVQPELSRGQLGEAVGQFDGNLEALQRAATSPEVQYALAGLRAAWVPLRAAALGPVQQAGAAQLDARAEDVLMAAERLTRVLQDQTNAPMSRWVNLADRQRMLSQRLVKLYMLQQWGVSGTALRNEVERVQNEFAGAHATMRQRAEEPVLQAELDKLALQWEWLHTVLATEGAESFRLIMAEGGEAVLELADQITYLYEQAAR
jgi:hypothetical protein